MWKIRIEYQDKSKVTLTGNHKEIPLELAEKYFDSYVANRVCKATYQQYPKSKYKEVQLIEKIDELQMY